MRRFEWDRPGRDCKLRLEIYVRLIYRALDTLPYHRALPRLQGRYEEFWIHHPRLVVLRLLSALEAAAILKEQVLLVF